MTGLVLLLAALVLICAGILAIMVRFQRTINDVRPAFYQGRRRWPSTRHPAWRRAQYLHMQRVDDAQVADDVERGMAAINQLLEQEAR